jgi:hypothetical protein
MISFVLLIDNDKKGWIAKLMSKYYLIYYYYQIKWTLEKYGPVRSNTDKGSKRGV